MDAWLRSPKGMVAGTKMSFAGLGSPDDRANVMAYLKANGGGPDYPAPAAAPEATAEGDAAAAAAAAEAGGPATEPGAAAAGATAAPQPADVGAATANE